ncbi:MAG: hypothetical protein BWY82_01224 [Verrucomicrobia bacterium ADurb.Bin474]|nr:MAG: hypothetical protein BWY82_01224 [Verrucomicrobia bacterium ADurb.Bin474]
MISQYIISMLEAVGKHPPLQMAGGTVVITFCSSFRLRILYPFECTALIRLMSRIPAFKTSALGYCGELRMTFKRSDDSAASEHTAKPKIPTKTKDFMQFIGWNKQMEMREEQLIQ